MSLFDLNKESLKRLRNNLAADKSQQEQIVQKQDFLDTLSVAIKVPDLTLLAWQCMYNGCVGQPAFLDSVTQKFAPDMEQQVQVLNGDKKVTNVVAAIAYLSIKEGRIWSQNFLWNLLKAGESEFAQLALKHLLCEQKGFLAQFYTDGGLEQRLSLADLVDDLATHKVITCDDDILVFIKQVFKDNVKHILTTLKADQSIEPSEVLALLNVLCTASAMDEYRHVLQADMSLLIDTLYLLKMLHEVGKSGEDTVYSPARKLMAQEEEHETNPVFGFKRDLIRLIGNLCYQHKANQDQVRDNSGIELLLDCSSLDGKNPYIMQWVVLAVRNVCLGNKNNQSVLYSIDKNGQLDKRILSEIGMM